MASAVGIRAIAAPKGRIKPVSAINAPATRKAPTACAISIPIEAAIKAAPGVDHARTTGILLRQDKNRLPTAIEMHNTVIHEAICASVAPRLPAAAITTATDPPNPTKTATSHDITRDAFTPPSRPFSQGPSPLPDRWPGQARVGQRDPKAMQGPVRSRGWRLWQAAIIRHLPAKRRLSCGGRSTYRVQSPSRR